MKRLTRELRYSIALAAANLRRVLHEICEEYPPAFLKFDLRKEEEQPEKRLQNSDEDLYVQKYKLVAGVYRFCSFLGWLEICRQELVFLESSYNPALNKIEKHLQRFEEHLGDSHLNKATDWRDWKDAFIYSEEQRAIGDRMIISKPGIKSDGDIRIVMGYAQFCESLFRSPYGEPDYWIRIAIGFFFYGDKPAKDFRRQRLQLLLSDLDDILTELDNYPLSKEIESWQDPI